MTYIELFANLHIENLCSTLIFVPDRIILVGSSTKKLKRDAERYKALLAGRGFQPEFILRSANRNSLEKIVDTLSALIEQYDDCVFDITGGDDVFLVATGIAVSRHPNSHIQIHKINIRDGSIIDCDMDGITITRMLDPSLSVDEYITLYGGRRKYAKGDGIYEWNPDDGFRDDLSTMWDICRRDHEAWNHQISAFAHIVKHQTVHEDGTYASRSDLRSSALCHYNRILNELKKNGLIHYTETAGSISLSFKNERVKECLTTHGQILETVVYTVAYSLTDNDGKPYYSDVQNHVLIDWDDEPQTPEDDAEIQNEIDVMLTRGMVPVFISCKNGAFTAEELFKLNSVAENFGGKYARKVLITTYLSDLMQSKPAAARHLIERADELGIRLIRNAETMSMSKLEGAIKSLAE